MESRISFQHGPVLATWLRISGPFDIVSQCFLKYTPKTNMTKETFSI